MKRIKGLLLACLFIISGCSKVHRVSELSIFVTSDLHYLSDELVGEGVHKSELSSDGRVQEADGALIDALVSRCNKEKPNYLFISGDLTFNGELKSHQELVNKLDSIKDTKVIVTPGNHDINNLYSRMIAESGFVDVDNIDYEMFKSMYGKFGLNDALEVYNDTLNYVYKLDDNKMLVVLDTNLSFYNEEYGLNFVSGYVDENVLSWLDSTLEKYHNEGYSFISMSHHNLIEHNPLFKNNYTIGNSEALIEIYEKYDVSTHFSGHLHVQSIKERNYSSGKSIYDIASVSLLDYGNRIGKLDFYDNDDIVYSSFKIGEVNGYDDFDEYSFNNFYQKYYKKIDSSLDDDIKDFLAKVNCYYFDGDYASIRKLKNKSKYKDYLKNDLENNKYMHYVITNCDGDMHNKEIR